jgi:hypothetical protein
MPQSAIPPGRHAPVRPEWLNKRREEILEPDLPIVDPHHHLWDRPGNRYLFQDLLEDVGSGHNIVATCFEECRVRAFPVLSCIRIEVLLAGTSRS